MVAMLFGIIAAWGALSDLLPVLKDRAKTLKELADARHAGKEPILFAGTEDSFSAGLNLKEVASLDERGMEMFLRRMDDLMSRIYHHPAPTVACINGHASNSK